MSDQSMYPEGDNQDHLDPSDPNVEAGFESSEPGLASTAAEQADYWQNELIGPSPVHSFVEDFQANQSGDPFRLVQRFARAASNIITDTNQNAGGLYNASSQATSLFGHLANRLIQSAPLVNDRDYTRRSLSLTSTYGPQVSVNQTLSTSAEGLMAPRSSQELASGFISRAGVNEYRALINQPGELRGVFFQFQNESIVSSLVTRRDPWSLVTQRFATSTPNGPGLQTTAQILAPNEVTYAVGQILSRQRSAQVLGVQAYGSFHPKVGYVGSEQAGFKAFLGTQNITPALSGNNSLETLMVFNRPAPSASGGYMAYDVDLASSTEGAIATEVYQITNAITDLASTPSYTYRPGALRAQLSRTSTQRSYLYVESEIYGRITGAIQSAAFSQSAVANKDQVVVSMGEIALLLKTRGYAQDLIQGLETLAAQKRLVIVADGGRLQNFFDELRATKLYDPTKAIGINEHFVRLLMDSGSLAVAPTGYQHDKSIAIFGGSDRKLQFLNVGSANLSADSMLPISALNRGVASGEYFQGSLEVLNRTLPEGEYDASSPINLDVNLSIGFGRYRDDSRTSLPQHDAAVEAYLGRLNTQGKLYSYYNNLAGGRLLAQLEGTQQTFTTGYLAERSADAQQVEQLRQKLESLNQRLGGNLLEIQGRYDLARSDVATGAKQTGLTVRIYSQENRSVSAVVNLVVDGNGNVIVAESNKVITGSLFLNKSTGARTVASQTVMPGESVKLSGLDTATGFVATIARELTYQGKFALVDTVFNRLLESNPLDLQAASKKLIASAFEKVSPSLASSVEAREGRPTLNTLINSLYRNAQPETQAQVLTGVLSELASGDPTQQRERERLLSPVLSELAEPLNILEGTAPHYASTRLLTDVLRSDSNHLLSDLKRSLIEATESGRHQLARAQSTQASKLVSEVLAPFLASHELGYQAAQAQGRLPVYSEQAIHPDSSYGKLLSEGFLNPAAIKPFTKVGAAGEYYRAVGAVSHAIPLKLPGYGGLRSLNVVDADLSAGATVAYDLDLLLRSTPGLNKVTQVEYAGELEQVYKLLNRAPDLDLDQEFTQDSLYFLPFAKAEQIPQRLKNTVGTRPALDVSPAFAKEVRNLNPEVARFDAGAITNGRIREVLPQFQFEQVKRIATEFNFDYQKTQEFFRRQELDPTNTLHGVIGPAAMKRVALLTSMSLMGDSAFLNAGHRQQLGDVHRVTVKLSAKQTGNQLETEGILAKYLGKGTIVMGSPQYAGDGKTAQVLEELLSQPAHQNLNDQALQRALEKHDGGRYDHYMLKRERGELKVYMKEGLYTPSQNRYQRIGTFNQDGLITLNETATLHETEWGARREPITLKFPAFGKRHQEGISVVITTPHINNDNRGTITAATDVMTMWQAGSGSRVAGQGAAKAPVTVLEESLFQDVQNMLSTRDPGSLVPEAVRHEKLYGLFGAGHFKGFNFESGLFLLSQADSRNAINNLSGHELARNLSLLFVGDTKVKGALTNHLREQNLPAAHAVSLLEATDFSATKHGHLGKVALGLSVLVEQASPQTKSGDLQGVKALVLKVLQGDEQAATHLQTQARKLIQTVTEDPTHTIRFPDGRTVISEHSLVARGAGLLAHLSFMGSQLFSPNRASAGNLYDLNLGDTTRYLSDVAYRHKVDAIAATANFSLPSPTAENRDRINQKLQVLHAMQRNDVVVQDLKDLTISRSLVPTGTKDEVALEYQYLAGMSSHYLKAFSSLGGGSQAAKEIQKAFSTLVSNLSHLGLPSPSAKVEFRLAFPKEEAGFTSKLALDTHKLLLGYTSLSQKMGLLSDAIKGIGFHVEGEQNHLLKYVNLQRIATGFIGNGESSLEERGIAFNQIHGLTFFADSHSEASRLQTSRLVEELGVTDHFAYHTQQQRQLTPFELVTKVVRRSYESFIEDRKVSKVTGDPTLSFSEFVAQGKGGAAIQHLEAKYNVVSELTQGTHRIIGAPFTSDSTVLNDRIQRQLERLNEKKLSPIREELGKSVYKSYVEGTLAIEAELQTHLAQARSQQEHTHTQKVLTEVQKTKQIVLPQFSTELITHGSDTGRYRLTVLDPGQYEPTIGVQLGTDVLKRVPLLFPGHTDEALRLQLNLRQQDLRTASLRERIFNQPNTTISEAEKLHLQTYQETVEASRLTLMRLADTDLTRKAMGDRQSYTGAVGIATASFALDPNESVLGKRYQALIEDRHVGKVVANQFKLLRALATTSSQEHFEQQARMTHQLLDTLGYRGSETREQSEQTGISSRLDVTYLLEQAHQKTANSTDLHEHINNLEVHVFSALGNIDRQRASELINSGQQRELHNLVALSSGAIRRGGAPAGVSALTADQSISEVMDVTTYQQKLRREGSGLIPEAKRFRTGMIAPALSRLLSQLGDFDGDAYQFLLSGVGDHAKQLLPLQEAHLKSVQSLHTLELQHERRYHDEFEPTTAEELIQFSQSSEAIERARGTTKQTQSALQKHLQGLHEYSASYDKVRSKSLGDLRQFVGSYMALPDVITQDQSISTGTLAAMVQQFSGTLPQVEEASRFIHHTEASLHQVQSLLTQAPLSRLLDPSQNLNTLFPEGSQQFHQELTPVLQAARQQGVTNEAEFINLARDHFAYQGNLAMSFEQINKSLKKAAGTVLNPLDFAGLQSVIGQAGTELIGKTYNVLIPLLDQGMLEHAMSTGLKTTGSHSFRSVMSENLQSLAQEAQSPQEQQAFLQLHEKLITDAPEHLSDFQQKINTRFSGLTGTLGSLQQLIRDALKEKSEKGIINVLRETSYQGKSLAEALDNVGEADPVKADRERSRILQQAVMTKLGPDLAVGAGLAGSAGRLRSGQAHDPGLTGFGALLTLAEFAQTDSEAALHQKFLQTPEQRSLYNQSLGRGDVSTITDFAAKHVLNLLERSQASFLVSTFNDSTKDLLVSKYRQLGRESAETLNPVNQSIHAMVQEYEQERNTLTELPAIQNLDHRLLQEVSLLQVQHRNQEEKVLTVDHLKQLRTLTQESSKVRFNDGDVFSRMLGANQDTYNAYIRMLQRGQQPNMQDALYLASYKLDALQDSTQSTGLNLQDMSEADQHKTLRLLGLHATTGVLGTADQTRLNQALLRKSTQGLTGIEALQTSTAAMTQGVFGLMDEMHSIQHSDNPNLDRYEVLRKQLSGVYKDKHIDVDRLQNYGLVPLPHSAESTHHTAADIAASLRNQLNPVVSDPRRSDQRHLLSHDPRLEVLGAFTAPLVMIAASANLHLDERALSFGFDTLQAVASMSSSEKRLTTQLMGHTETHDRAAHEFMVGRIKDSLQTEGVVAGTLQGVIQEGLYKNLSHLAYQAIDHFGARGQGAPKAGNAIATVLAETVTTALALSISRGVSRDRTPAGQNTPDQLGDLLKSFSEQIWQLVEEAQLAALDPQYEVTDTADNQNFDFEATAVPSELEQDVNAGLVILDENTNPMPTEFDSTSSEQAGLLAVVPNQ